MRAVPHILSGTVRMTKLQPLVSFNAIALGDSVSFLSRKLEARAPGAV
jgi:hypothetical protein